MNTPASNDDDLRCAEYALGVLDAQERAALELDASRDLALQNRLDAWQQRLAPLSEDTRPIAPPERVWTRIRSDLGFAGGQPSTARQRRFWDSLRVWRWLTVGTSVAALVLLGAVVTLTQQVPRAPTTSTASRGYLVSTIARTDGSVQWSATIDLQRARLVVTPTTRAAIRADRATELWLVPPHAKPIALGVFPSDRPATLTLSTETIAHFSEQAVLAVSEEPPGGSPTGAPTGPVLATGNMHAI